MFWEPPKAKALGASSPLRGRNLSKLTLQASLEEVPLPAQLKLPRKNLDYFLDIFKLIITLLI